MFLLALKVAQKDARRFSLLILTVIFALIARAYFTDFQSPLEAVLDSSAILSIASIGNCLFWGILLFALVPLIIQEDNPSSNSAFWLTRPISKETMALGKIILLCIVGVVTPSIVQVLSLYLRGFPISHGVSVFVECALSNLVIVAPAAVIAACTPTTYSYFALLLPSIAFTMMVTGLFNWVPRVFEIFQTIPDSQAFHQILTTTESGVVIGGLLLIVIATLLFFQRYRVKSSVEIVIILLFSILLVVSIQRFFPITLFDSYIASRQEIPNIETTQIAALDLIKSSGYSGGDRQLKDWYAFKPHINSPEGYLLKLRELNGVEIWNENKKIRMLKQIIPNNFDGCVDRSEVLFLLKSFEFKNTEIAIPQSCLYESSGQLESADGRWLQAQQTVSLTGQGKFDVFKIESEFVLDSAKETTKRSYPKRLEIFDQFKSGMGLPLVEEDNITPIFESQKTIPTNQYPTSGTYPTELSSPAGYVNTLSSDTLVVFSVTETKSGKSVIEPLTNHSVYRNVSPLWPKALVEKTYWKSALEKPAVDYSYEGVVDHSTKVIAFRLSKIGSISSSIDSQNIKVVQINYD